MRSFRRRRMSVRFAILALLALLWSHAALAGHVACSLGSMAQAALAAATTAVDHDCHKDTPAAETVCVAHCDQDSRSSDVARVPGVPALPAVIPPAVSAIACLPNDPVRQRPMPPSASWHRPTAHPAALLLI